MEVDSQVIVCTCGRRQKLEAGIAGNEILITTYLQLINVQGTETKRGMKDIVRRYIAETGTVRMLWRLSLNPFHRVATLIAQLIEIPPQ
ncbi:hypothetical protein TNCT_333361 [Trichonephila clavata]|uniref:Uncharacterized protein n=1 Tax=Trichonephila clavata TaxID=2740835 RepID=A0A8X6H8A7_TRICU|nr:hypothetical protein TNCT_333361 [Trichonephila clavata]